MLTLLWKDQRINRLVLITGAVLLLGPPITGLSINTYSSWKWDVPAESWPVIWLVSGQVSLIFSMITFGMLGGNAVASERVDRSAEFLAYLPPTRRAIIASKAILAVGVGSFVFLAGLGVLYLAVSLAGPLEEHQIAERSEFLGAIAPTAALIFGSAWLASCMLTSSVIATCIGYAAPWVVYCVLAVFKYALGFEDLDLSAWYLGVSVVLAVLCFTGGIAYYIRRVEP